MRKGLVLVVLLCAAPALAAPTPDMVELAKKEFEQGQTDFNLGHYERALEHFENSYRLAQKPALLFNLAYVNAQLYGRTRNLAQLDQAIDRFKAFLDSTTNASDPQTLGLREKATRFMDMSIKERTKERAKRAAGEESLTVGEELLAKGQPDDALAQVEKFESAKGNERSGILRALLLRAGIAAAKGDLDGAADWCGRAQTLEKVKLPDSAPEGLRNACEVARQALGGKELDVAHTPPGSLKPGMPVVLNFTRSDPARMIDSIVLHYHAGSGGAFSSITSKTVGAMTLPRDFGATLQPGTKLEYYVDVLDKNGGMLEHVGTSALPFSVTVGKLPGKPIVKRWWFWTVLGGVAAAAALGGGLGWYYSQPAPPINVPISAAIEVK